MTETSAKIIADSVSPAGHRITTFLAVYPRIILSEINTHRLLSRVSASSRAIPVEKMIRRVMEDPYVPVHWGKNQRGMRAEEDVAPDDAYAARQRWLWARDSAVAATERLLRLGIHKQITNRLLEPFMWHPTVLTATEWDNWDHLRDHKAAHPDFRDLAHCMRELRLKSEPKQLSYPDWHLPFIGPEDAAAVINTFDEGVTPSFPTIPTDPGVIQLLCKVSVGRCARVSTLTHDGKRDLQADIDLHDKMFAAGHTSPYENVARPMTPDELEIFKQKRMRRDPESKRWSWVGAHYEDSNKGWWDGEYTHFLGNVQGWVTLRKQIPYEDDILGERP